MVRQLLTSILASDRLFGRHGRSQRSGNLHGGEPKVDRENPDPELRGRPIVGLRLTAKFDHTGKDQWKRPEVQAR
jgi:hypothetical protein